MNKKIITIILSLILLVSVTTSIMAVTELYKESNKETLTTVSSIYSSPVYTTNENATITKQLDVSKITPTVNDNSVIYAASQKINESYTVDIYNDSLGNEYWYNSADEIVGYRRGNTEASLVSLDNSKDKLSKINEQTVIPFAEKYAYTVFGEQFDKYVLEEVFESGNNYYVLFELLGGKDSFIHIRRCSVRISKDGYVGSCILSQKVYNNPTDLEVLSSISKDEIVSNVTKQLTEFFSDAKEISVQNAFLTEGCKNIRVVTEFCTDIESTSEMLVEHNISLIDGNKYTIDIYYPLS